MNGPSRSSGTVRRSGSRRRRRWRGFLAAIALLILSTSATGQVLVVLSDGAAGYEAVADELRAGLKPLRDGTVRVDSVSAARLASVDGLAFDSYELVVPVGLAAAQAVLSREQSRP